MNKLQFKAIFAVGLILLATLLHLGTNRVKAQDSPLIQEITGGIDATGTAIFTLDELKKGQTIYVFAEGTGGNFDPIIALSMGDIDRAALRAEFYAGFDEAVASGQDPIVAMGDVLDQFFLAWDDDGGGGYSAAFSYVIPEDGDYLLILTSTLIEKTFGDYRLLVGVDAPEVLSGNALPTSDVIAVKDQQASSDRIGVQASSGTLSEEKSSTFFNLTDFLTGDTLYAKVETTSGDLVPILTLEDYGGKPVRISNYNGADQTAIITYTFPVPTSNFRLNVEACCADSKTSSGDFRLVTGLNNPQVVEGAAIPAGRKVIVEPIDTKVGLKLQQITNVDQKAENYSVVATMILEWTDPANAFSPEECQCRFKTFSDNDFDDFAKENNIVWPEFTLFNQQGNRWTQNQVVILWPDGEALYFERFSTTLQAPDFNFRLFPFDVQHFFIRIDSLFPTEFFSFSEAENFSELGEELGEEEWTIIDHSTTITAEVASTSQPVSSFSFNFEARRHLSFYIIRIFIPIFIILTVSWVTFFLQDYGRRVDVAAGNLLLFIAFNFTISGDLPRLGYLTFLDTVLISTFAVTALVVVFNVILKRLEGAGKGDFAQRLDKYTIWIYPIAYVAALGIVVLLFT